MAGIGGSMQKNMAGSHVIVQEQAETLPDATFEEAGALQLIIPRGVRHRRLRLIMFREKN